MYGLAGGLLGVVGGSVDLDTVRVVELLGLRQDLGD